MSDRSPADEMAEKPRRRWIAVTVGAVLLVTAVAVAATALPSVLAPARPRPAKAVALPTVEVARQDLAVTTSVDGELGYGEATPITVKATGTVTWLPSVGQTIDRGGTLVRVDDKPVLAFVGELPLYRPLDTEGMTGADVSMAAANLAALGVLRVSDPAKARVDARFQAAVKLYQKKSGLPEDGVVAPSWVQVLPAAGRVSAVGAHLGDASGGALLSMTGTAKSVTAEVDASAAPAAAQGSAVTLVLPSGAETSGHITAIGSPVASTGDGSGGGAGAGSDQQPKVALTVSVDDPAAVAALDTAPVTIRVPSATRTGVLAVPIAALLALREGGFALQKKDGALVGVTTGLFAGDLVEVSGAGVVEGMRVVTAR